MSGADGFVNGHLPAESTRDTTIPVRRWLMAVMLLVLNLTDVIMTKAILSYGGREANPLMAPIIDHPLYPVLLKTIIAVGVGALLLASPRESKMADRAVGFVLVGYTILIGWNIGILAAQSAPHLG